MISIIKELQLFIGLSSSFSKEEKNTLQNLQNLIKEILC